MARDTREKRDLHALDDDGMLLCNPRDREAAHRAEMEGIGTYDLATVTCRKCQSLMYQRRREARSDDEQASQSPPEPVATGPDVAEKVAKFRRVRDVSSMVAEVREGDGQDPREEKRKQLYDRSRGKPDYASQRLASQIFEALSLSTWLVDIGLPEFAFVRITPAASRGKYLVDVSCLDLNFAYDPQVVEGILREHKGNLRTEVAQAVNRHKAPDLQLRLLPSGFSL